MDTEKKVNILIVGDEPSNLAALEDALQYLGQGLVKASSGQEALRCGLERDFALILLDVQMPDLSAFEVATMIREQERTRHIPIIFLTDTMWPKEILFKGYSAGPVDCLMKPIVSGILRAKVEVFVELAVARWKLEQEVIERSRVAAEITKLNRALEQKNEDLIAANANLETFSYSVSHDLRAPLRHILGFIDMFEETATLKMDDSERQCLGKIANAARRMGLMIDGLLTFSRVGSASMSRFEVPMDGLVKEIIAGISQNLNNRHIEWKTDPLPVVLGDVNLLRQVWSNLLNNAVKYTRPRDPAKIEIGSELQLNEVVYYVRDNGVGFEMEFAEKLFSVFNRLHSEKDFEGTGMGLANVRRIIQRHGGRTWVDAKLNEGATFFFSLPEYKPLKEELG